MNRDHSLRIINDIGEFLRTPTSTDHPAQREFRMNPAPEIPARLTKFLSRVAIPLRSISRLLRPLRLTLTWSTVVSSCTPWIRWRAGRRRAAESCLWTSCCSGRGHAAVLLELIETTGRGWIAGWWVSGGWSAGLRRIGKVAGLGRVEGHGCWTVFAPLRLNWVR